ncbi:MAG: Sec-dependent nitrous-oxide reductase [Pseudomonadota bacterium]|nr:Sec-dependent nitrous-oxide reductase [Pseudomonadota bacterium]
MNGAGLILRLLTACEVEEEEHEALGGDLESIMESRGLSEADILAAAKTYTPSGKLDEYVLLASGGHSGLVLAIGVPSMRILKYVAVFSPEPFQGYGMGGLGDAVLYGEGKQRGRTLTWGDIHHPNLSETNGDYDGEFMFVNDKANSRIAVIDLTDFMTKQIVTNPLLASSHGGAIVTPNTEYVLEVSQYATPLGGGFAPLADFQKSYRGAATFWKFDREKGRIDPARSFAVELPPYAQDISDAGKFASDGYVFLNSWDTEMAAGTLGEGKPFLESGASQNDMDYLHVVDLRKAESLVAAGRAVEINGMRVLPLDVAAKEHVLVFVPEPKSPHGCDVTPDGTGIVVAGKLDTHASVYEFSKIKDLIERGEFTGTDPFGVSVLDFQKSLRGQVEIGLGPLHTTFDDTGHAYTSVFLDSTVVRWNYTQLDEPPVSMPVQYNIGHLTAAEGDTAHPKGKWVVAMNKMSQDRYVGTGPLQPQNFQLIDISGPTMQLIADLPIGLGEPHYAQLIKADKLKTLQTYTPAGVNPYTDARGTGAVAPGEERVERSGKKVDVYMTVIRSHFTPDTIEVNEGDEVTLHITSIEQARDQTHGFAIDMYNVSVSLEPGRYEEVTFLADTPGVFPFYCTEFCSALHLEMAGYLLVRPKGG